MLGGTVDPGLGEHEGLREGIGHATGQGRHGVLLAVGVGVNAKSIDAHLGHPPQDVGPHVALQVGVELIHVGHHAVKPTVVEPGHIHVLAVRIHHHAAAVVGALRFREVPGPLVHPGAVDGVGEETVKVAPVVGHPIVDDANASRVGFTGQRFVVLQGAQSRVDPVAVCAGVAVVGRFGQIVFHDRRHPHGPDPQVAEVVQFAGHALEVAPVTGVHFGAVHTSLEHAGHIVVARITIRESVRHDEVHRRRLMPGVQAVLGQGRGHSKRHSDRFAAIPEHLQFHFARRRHAMDVQCHPNVSLQRSLAPSFQYHLVILTAHLGDVRPIGVGDQDFHPALLEVAPPVGWIDGCLRQTDEGTEYQGCDRHK